MPSKLNKMLPFNNIWFKNFIIYSYTKLNLKKIVTNIPIMSYNFDNYYNYEIILKTIWYLKKFKNNP